MIKFLCGRFDGSVLAQNGNVEVMAASSMCSIVSHFSDKIFGNILVFLCSIEVIFLPCVVDAIGAAQNEAKHGRECGALSKPFELGDSLKCRKRIFKTQPFALSLNQKTYRACI